MTVRNRADLGATIDNLLPDNMTREVSPADVRAVLVDIIDSLAFRAQLVTDIDALLQGMTWQQGGGGGGGGITVQQALDAIRAEGVVSGIELVKDTSVDNQITLRLQMQAIGAHGRYAALVDNPNGDPADFPAAVFTAAGAIMANDDELATPAYAGASQFVTIAFATPNRMTGAFEVGNDLAGDQRAFFAPAVGAADVQIAIPGAGAHYVYANIINAQTAGNIWRLVEESA